MKKLLVAFFAVVSVLATGVSARAAPAVRYGEWNPNWQAGGGVDNSVISARESDMGHRLDLVHWYAAADEGYSDYDHIMVDQAIAIGRTPFVSWGLPVGFTNTAVLDDWAKGIKTKAPNRVYIRLFWEFNDPPSNTTNATWGVCHSTRTPAQLVQSWRSIVDRFRADGATNVRWVWNPDGTLGSQMYGDECGSIAAAYPGDSYVDFRGFDTFGNNNQHQYDRQNAQTGSSKPMLLGEVGGLDSNGEQSWVAGLSTLLNNGSLPLVQAVVYFNDSDWAFGSNPNVHAAVKSTLATTAFAG